MVFSATEKGVRSLWSSPRLGLDASRLYLATVASGEHGLRAEPADEDELVVVAGPDRQRLARHPRHPWRVVFPHHPQTPPIDDNPAMATDVTGGAPQPQKTWPALLILVLVVVAAAANLAPIPIVAIAGAVAMVGLGS